MSAHNHLAELLQALQPTIDPGASGTLTISGGVTIYEIVTTGAEGRTIPTPTKSGLKLVISHKTAGGTLTLTGTTALDAAGSTSAVMASAGDTLILESVATAADTFRWRAVCSDGTTGLTEEFGTVNVAGLKIGGTTVDATAAELNRAADKSASVISNTATTLSITVAEHASRTVILACTTTEVVSLPAATGSGETFVMIVGATSTDGNKVIAANGTDVMLGMAYIGTPSSTDGAIAASFQTSATSDKITFNKTTTGGNIGNKVVLVDIAANTWNAMVYSSGTTNTGTGVTPFSQT